MHVEMWSINKWNLIDQWTPPSPPPHLPFLLVSYWAFTESKSDSFRACVLLYDAACSRVYYPVHGLPVILEIACSQKKKGTMEFYSGKKRGKPLCCVLWVVSVNLHWPNNWHALCWLCVKQRLACWLWWILFVVDFMVFIFWYFFQNKICQAFCTIFCA